jgi:hypothetical protein
MFWAIVTVAVLIAYASYLPSSWFLHEWRHNRSSEATIMPCPKDFSRVDSTGRAYAGSQRQIQTYLNEKTSKLNSAIAHAFSQYGMNEAAIRWVSPLKEDVYSEYRDSEFLERVGYGHLAPALRKFWPRNGPCWDALARIEGGCLLIEAKSHVTEIYGEGCGASGRSKERIQAALDSTKAWLGVSSEVDWTGRLYQSANRYASLCFLRKIAGLQGFLVNVYFIDDPRTRTTKEEWDTAIRSVNQELGLVGEVPYSAAVFLKAE